MCTVLLPPGVNPTAVYTIYQTIKLQTTMLSTHKVPLFPFPVAVLRSTLRTTFHIQAKQSLQPPVLPVWHSVRSSCCHSCDVRTANCHLHLSAFLFKLRTTLYAHITSVRAWRSINDWTVCHEIRYGRLSTEHRLRHNWLSDATACVRTFSITSRISV
jgi:hypothetical protein